MNDKQRILAAFKRQLERDRKRAAKRVKSYQRLSRMAEKNLSSADGSKSP